MVACAQSIYSWRWHDPLLTADIHSFLELNRTRSKALESGCEGDRCRHIHVIESHSTTRPTRTVWWHIHSSRSTVSGRYPASLASDSDVLNISHWTYTPLALQFDRLIPVSSHFRAACSLWGVRLESMFVKHLSLTNFRLYARLELDLPRGLVVVQGDNAQGKTSLLEAMYFLATTHSPRSFDASA